MVLNDTYVKVLSKTDPSVEFRREISVREDSPVKSSGMLVRDLEV